MRITTAFSVPFLSLILVSGAYAHAPSEHRKVIEKSSCDPAQIKRLQREAPENDPVMEAIMQQCAQQLESTDRSTQRAEGVEHDEHRDQQMTHDD
ncbi:MAG: hypothetical protein KBT87_03855 [Gammaproteobacteria bacterium]|jgi:hypothetical protein|nr:hypothetical protein [Gammaproteobacteria bacterium]MBQ0773788.1 hypothetical protein [Gammaproteobacteria bacterium]|tara:strand:+ start:38119 stop:38403 length:285 start_codon:yes stop_codon:yes gene_type:complete